MLFAVRMDVHLPVDIHSDARDDLMTREQAYGQTLKRSGKRRHVWRIAGHMSNLSVFDVDDNDELHQLLTEFPMFAFTTIDVTALAAHPADPAGG